jgi:hypothetical protein
MNTKIHCPDCATGYLRRLSDEELLRMFPMSRASQCVRHPEELRTQYVISPKGNMYEIWAKPNRVGMYCEECGHFHDMDERSLKQANNSRYQGKPKTHKIKGYGNYHY